ncbi:MFS transporter [Sphingomonas sp. LT1P40]|uniref:MFS transporter n=1 Tax=Alteristakelama amylovorans TaxID=3096166 RepID=UPI002FCA33F2
MTDNRFMANFLLLALVSGLTVGLGKVVTTIFAIDLGATAFQVGVIASMESIGMILVTVPAGFIIARYGARGIYFASSLGPMLVNIAMPFAAGWAALAAGRWLIGLCIPFRMVAMNSSFLERLRGRGETRGGWYRGALTAGMAILGPASAGLLIAGAGITTAFLIVAALFGIMAVFSLSFLPARQPESAEGGASFLTEIGTLLANPAIAESCFIEFLSAATGALFGTFILLLAPTIPLLTTQDGITLLLIQGVAAVALLFLSGTIVARLGRATAYTLALTLATSALLSLGLAQGFAALAAGAVLLSASAAIVHLINVRMLAALPGVKSKAAGLYNLASMTGSSVGALGGGLLTKFVPLQSVFLLWLPILFAGAAFAFARHRIARPLTAQEVLP